MPKRSVTSAPREDERPKGTKKDKVPAQLVEELDDDFDDFSTTPQEATTTAKPPAKRPVPDSDSDDDYKPATFDVKKVTEPTSTMPQTKEKKEALNICIPEGKILACPVGTKVVTSGMVVGVSVKENDKGPCTFRVNALVTNISPNAGKDVVRTEQAAVGALVLAKEEKVSTTTDQQVYAKLIATDVPPTFKPYAGVLQVTLSNLKGDRGVRETLAKEVRPGATVQFTELKLTTYNSVYATCDDFKVISKPSKEAPREGVTQAVDAVRTLGAPLLAGCGFNCSAFREAEAPTPECAVDFNKVKEQLASIKASFVSCLASYLPKYQPPPHPLLFNPVDSFHVPPPLSFYMTKMEHPKEPEQGLLLHSAQHAVILGKQGRLDELVSTYNGKPIVAAEVTGFRVSSSKFSGDCYEVQTKLHFVPDLTALPTKPKNVLALDGPTLIVPLPYFAAPFGVDERATLDLLGKYVIPFANMIAVPDKAKMDEEMRCFKGRVDCCQLTIDVHSTLRNVGFKLSAKAVKKIYGDSESSTPAVGVGESLVDAHKAANMANKEPDEDPGHWPKVSTLQDGGVVSLRATAVLFEDATLEFYGVVPKMAVLSQGPGMLRCGTDTKVGNAAFLKVFNGEPVLALDAVKKGSAAIFAVRVAPKKETVAAGSSTSA